MTDLNNNARNSPPPRPSIRSFAIIPAAGHSRRMGQPKLLLPWGQAIVIERVLAAWRTSKVDEVIVVVRPDDEPLSKACAAAGASVVRPEKPPAEMKDSVLLGLARAAEFGPAAQDAWLVAPADLPSLSPAVIDRVLAAYMASLTDVAGPRIWVPRCGGRRGHPVVFSWALAAEVSELAHDEGLNVLLGRHAIGHVDVEPHELESDLDTPEDYERLRPRES